MILNMGNTDRWIRILIVVILYGLVYAEIITGTPKVVVGLVGAVVGITAFLGVCPLYTLLGINSCPVNGSDLN